MASSPAALRRPFPGRGFVAKDLASRERFGAHGGRSLDTTPRSDTSPRPWSGTSSGFTVHYVLDAPDLTELRPPGMEIFAVGVAVF